MVMRERRRRDRAARRRLLSCSSWSASASRYSCTNIGCMVAPLPRLVALLLGQSVSCGQKYVLLEQTPGRPGIHRALPRWRHGHHPFAAVPLGFSVMGARTLWWGGCAWDSFALPHLLPGEDEVLVATRCPACGRPHAWSVGRQRPPDGGQVRPNTSVTVAADTWPPPPAGC